MDGEPEGSDTEARGRPFWSIIAIAVFAVYIGFRLVQGAIWLIGRF